MRSLTELRHSVSNYREVDSLKDRFAEGLLQELQPHPNWVVWKFEGEQKPPFNPRAIRGNYYKAASTQPRTWGTLDEALAALETNQFDGLGFMLDNKRIPLTLIDLDHCLKEERNRTACTDIHDPRVLEPV